MTKTILTVGDSITGWSDLSSWFKWSHILEVMLEARFGAGAYRVINRGIGGNTTRMLLDRLETDVIDLKPDIVVLLLGGNDASAKAQIPRAETAANLRELSNRITAVCPRLLLLQYHLLIRPDTPEQTWAHLITNNDLIADVASEQGCPLLAMDPPMKAAANPALPEDGNAYREFGPWSGAVGHRVRDLVGVDGVHLNGAGELVYGRSVFHKLLELNWLDQAPQTR